MKRATLFCIFMISCLFAGCTVREQVVENTMAPVMTEAAESLTVLPTVTAEPEQIVPLEQTVSIEIAEPSASVDIIYLEDTDVTYEEIVFMDSVELVCKQGMGWAIDLNGDGTKEKLYGNETGIFINEKLVISGENAFDTEEEKKIFWLLDVDREDGFLEIVTYHDLGYDMWFYDENSEGQQVGKDVCGWFDTSKVYEEASDIRKPVRVDEHTISFQDWHFVFDSYSMMASYCLNEEHELIIVAQDYEIDYPHPIAYLNQESELKLYSYRDLESEYVQVVGPQVYMLTKSDGCNWVYLENYFGYSGWIYVAQDEFGQIIIDENLGREDFAGYSNVP